MCNSDIYLIYLRKSRADSPDESIEEVLARHERQLQETAISKLGHMIDEKFIYREIVSGETIEDRPEIKKVLHAIEAPTIKGVLVIEPQRLSRGDWMDGGQILASFKYSQTLIITPGKTYDLNNKFDYKYIKMELSQGNDYLEYTKEILSRGRIASVKEGNYIGSIAPFGYCKVFIDKSPTLEINEKEAKIIQMACKMYADDNKGWSYVAHELDRLGLKPRKGGQWAPYNLRDICINPINIGKVRWNARKEEKQYKEGKLVRTRPRNRDDIILADGKHPPIVDLDLYERVIAKAGSKPREKKAKEIVNPLAGLIYCGKCDRAMTYRTYKDRNGDTRSAPRLLCTNQVHCKTKSTSFDPVYNILIESLEEIVKDFEIQLKNDDTRSRFELQSQMIKDIEKELDKLEKRQDEIYDFLEDGTYTKEVFLRRNAKLAHEREALEKRLKQLNETIIEPIDYQKKIYKFNDVINALKNDEVSAKQKNALLKSVIKRIYYFRNAKNRTKWDTSKPEIKIILKDF